MITAGREGFEKLTEEKVRIAVEKLMKGFTEGLPEEDMEAPMEELTEEEAGEQTKDPVKESKKEMADELVRELAECAVENIEELSAKPVDEAEESPCKTVYKGEEPKEEAVEETLDGLTGEPSEETVENVGDSKNETTKESIEEQIQETMEKSTAGDKADARTKNYSRVVIGIMISLFTLLAIYFGMAQYFINRFYFGSEINDINVSCKTIEDAKAIITSELEKHILNLKEIGGQIEQIKGGEVGLSYHSDEEFIKLKNSQNPYKWLLALFTAENTKMTVRISYDEKLLKQRIDNLSCFDSNNVIEPQNPSFEYKNNQYVIIDEIHGNKVDKDILYSHVADAILKQETEIDLESLDCYIKPQYDSKSPKTIEVRDTLNKYVSSKITYTFGDSRETVDGSIINKWLSVDENLEILLDEKKVRDYVIGLSKAYDTISKERTFVTSSGETISIGGGDYGRSIDIDEETKELIENIKAGKSVTRIPSYSQKAFYHGKNDIGDTYVEIDIAKQYIWFYKNGSLVVEGDIVTGNVRNGHSTPKGIYKLKYKQKNAVLRGPGYAAPVTFWMPFNGGIGIHDASWRNKFGGNIYKTDGSHGCINCPYNVAKEIFNNIEPGTPVICY